MRRIPRNRTHRIAAALLAALLLASCVPRPKEEEDFSASYTTDYAAAQAARTPSIAETGQVLTDPAGSDSLRRRLGTPSLMGHKTSWDGSTLQLDCTFSPAVTLAELTEARRFALEKLLLAQLDETDPGYYDNLISSAPVAGKVERVICRLFIGDTMALQDVWSHDALGGGLLQSYENTLPALPLREGAPLLLSAAAAVVKGDLPSAQLALQCSVTDRALLLQIKTDRHIDPELAENWREPLARELARRATATDGQPMPVLVVQYFAGSQLYCEDVCLTVDGLSTWLGECDWVNMPEVQAVLERIVPEEEMGEAELETEPTEPEDLSEEDFEELGLNEGAESEPTGSEGSTTAPDGDTAVPPDGLPNGLPEETMPTESSVPTEPEEMPEHQSSETEPGLPDTADGTEQPDSEPLTMAPELPEDGVEQAEFSDAPAEPAP